MGWFALSLLAGLFFASSRVVARLVLRRAGNPLAFVAIHDFLSGLVLLPFLFISFSLPTKNETWLFFLGIVVFAFLTDWLAFTALRAIDVSMYNIICQIRHILILFGGLLIFQETITFYKVIAIILIITGVAIALYEKTKFKFDKGIFFTLLSTFFAIIAFLFAKQTVTDFDEVTVASLELILVGILGFSLLGFQPSKLVSEIKIQKWGLIIAGILFGGFEVLLFMALKIGEASRVIPVTQSSLLFALLAGILLLNERSRLLQKIFGSIIIALGIALMYLL
ncbi:DMT family transporter [Patescibacteria group bacterium]|nr:DMT family transporter [Patescibacteria group bacterium]MBU1890786.1 DMT family transporter [Patescibacteria group bacterium]